MHDSFVRTEMLAPQDPPLRETGAVKWLRENLFSGPLNTILTLLGAYIVVTLVLMAFPWWWNGVWNATSLAECRAKVAEMGAESGACWAVIKARWHQYIFGFYPMDQYWRPVLTAGLLLAALAPVLYWNDRKGAILTGIAGVLAVISMLLLSSPVMAVVVSAAIMAALFVLARIRPRQMIWVTLAYPFAALFLLWGGQVWTYLSAILAVAAGIGFGLLYGQPRKDARNLI